MVAMRGLFAAGVVALCSLQCDASDLRGMIKAKVGRSCDSDEPEPVTLASAPSSFIASEASRVCAAPTVAIYILTSGQWVKFCGTTCTVTETVTADAEVGGQDCAGNKQVTVTLSGASVFLGMNGLQPQVACVPFGDVKPLKVVAADAANMAGCTIANKLFGCMVTNFRTAGNAVARLATAAGGMLAAEATKWVNAAGNAVDKTGKVISNTGNNIGNRVKNAFGGR
jgi:hypothetical protein